MTSASPESESPGETADLIALDVTVLPGKAVREQALQANRTLRDAYPDGFALGDDYVPHVSVLQLFVDREVLDLVEATVQDAVNESGVTSTSLTLTSKDFSQGQAIPDSEPALFAPKLDLEPNESLLNLQQTLITSLQPFMSSTGTESAFRVTAADRRNAERVGLPVILPVGIQLVEEYLSAETGSNYAPHITVGLADQRAWRRLSEQKFSAQTAASPTVALCHLGPYDSCHRVLKEYPLS